MGAVLSGHFEATRERLPQAEAPVLALHDTTEFTYKREDMAAVGLVSIGQPGCVVHVDDQESDIFDLFGVARQLETHFLVRTRADRLADGGPEAVAEAIGQSPRRGLYRIAVRNRKGEEPEAVLEIRYRRLQMQMPKGKKKRYPEQTVTVIEAREQQTPPDRERIDWKLITDLTVRTRREAVEKVQWYALEDQGLSQDPEIGLPGRTVAPQNHRAADESAGCVLHPELRDWAAIWRATPTLHPETKPSGKD